MDPRERFTATVSDYARYRPSYPDALIAWLYHHAPGRRAVDLGSGTGIFSRQLAAAGFEVTGIEPNAAMRAEAERAGGGPRYQAGQAESTGLPDASADLVVGAQSFHWFDLDRALPEIDRILVPGGLAAAVWNERVDEGFAATYEAVLCRFSTDYAHVARPGKPIDGLRARGLDVTHVIFPNAQLLDLDGVLGRAWSSSYVVHGVEDREGFDAALAEAFRVHAVEGRVELQYKTSLYAWRPRR